MSQPECFLLARLRLRPIGEFASISPVQAVRLSGGAIVCIASSNETRAAISANPSRQLYGNGRLLADLELRDLVSMHFVWAIGKPKGAGMCIGMGKAKLISLRFLFQLIGSSLLPVRLGPP